MELLLELLCATYIIIGLIIGAERLSRVTEHDDSSMVCIGIITIIVFWPLYIVYKRIISEY